MQTKEEQKRIRETEDPDTVAIHSSQFNDVIRVPRVMGRRKPTQTTLFDDTAVDDWGDSRDTRTTMKRLL